MSEYRGRWEEGDKVGERMGVAVVAKQEFK